MTSSESQQNRNPASSTWLAQAFRTYPFLAHLSRVVLTLTQPRFTAGVVGVVLNDHEEVLIVEHAFHPRNAWGLPGGWLGARENPEAGLRRELREELELDVEVVCPLAVDTGYYSRSHLDIAFLCRAKSTVGNLSFELLSYRWMPLEAVSQLLPFHRRAVEAARSVRQSELGNRSQIPRGSL